MANIRLNDADEAILQHIQEGRVTAAFLAKRTNWEREYLTQRLIRLDEHGLVQNLEGVGLYELLNKPVRA